MDFTKKLALLASAFVASLTCAGIARGQVKAEGISDGKVKIGVLTDLSGVFSDAAGRGSVEAARMAIEDFGGNVRGAPIELLVADHQNKADIGAAKAREWFDQQGVDMITDVVNSSVALAVARLLPEKRRVMMVVGSGSTRLTNEDCTPYTVHYAYDSYSNAVAGARAIVKRGGKRWFFVTQDFAFGYALEKDASAAVRQLGGQVVGSVRHPLGAADFSSYILQAQSSKAEVIGLATAGGDFVNAVKSANEFGVTKRQSLAGLFVTLSEIRGLGLQATQGLLYTEGWYWDSNDETRKFARRFFERMKRMPSMFHAGVYSSVTTYLKAVQASQTDSADAVMKAMRSSRIRDMFTNDGQIRADGRMVHDMYLAEVKRPEDSKYPWDYVRIVATIAASEAFQPLASSTCAMVKSSTTRRDR